MKISKYVIGASIAAIVFAGKSFASVDDAVDDYCGCAGPVFGESEKIKNAMQSGDLAAMQNIATKMQSISGGLVQCMEDLKAKYQHKETDEKFKQEVMAGVEKQCPNPMKGGFPMPGKPLSKTP